MAWLGFDGSRTMDGTALDCSSTRSHDKEFILYGCIIGACFVLGWLAGQL